MQCENDSIIVIYFKLIRQRQLNHFCRSAKSESPLSPEVDLGSYCREVDLPGLQDNMSPGQYVYVICVCLPILEDY